MNQMDRDQALEIMELSPDATRDDIAKRYGVLTRKFRSIEKDERGYTIEDVTEAYNFLMGITYMDKNEEERKKALRENPPLLARILGVDPIKLENFFHYYKIHMIVGLVAVIVLIFSIRSCVNQVNPDFTIICYGKLFAQDQTAVENNVKERVAGINAPSVQVFSTAIEDPQYLYATQMKFVAMIAAQEVDVIIMDRENFDVYASQGVFLPLDDLADEWEFPEESYVRGSEMIDEDENGEPVYGPERIYGIDITETDFIKDNGIYANSAVVGICRNTQKVESSVEFVGSLSE